MHSPANQPSLSKTTDLLRRETRFEQDFVGVLAKRWSWTRPADRRAAVSQHGGVRAVETGDGVAYLEKTAASCQVQIIQQHGARCHGYGFETGELQKRGPRLPGSVGR